LAVIGLLRGWRLLGSVTTFPKYDVSHPTSRIRNIIFPARDQVNVDMRHSLTSRCAVVNADIESANETILCRDFLLPARQQRVTSVALGWR
jgi:hypothetical protein